MPPSYPPLTELPENEACVYYDKKAAVFYGNIAPDQEYRLKIKLESNAATFEFATLFPYKEVRYPKIDMTSSSDFGIEPTASLVYSTTSKEFPEWYEYHLSKLLSMEPTRPLSRPAIPERGTMPLFEEQTKLESEYDTLLEEEDVSEQAMRELMKEIITLSELIKNVVPIYDFAKPHEKETIVRVIFSELFIAENTLEYKVKEGFEPFVDRISTVCDSIITHARTFFQSQSDCD